MAEVIKTNTDTARLARKELLRKQGEATRDLAATIPDKCSGCEEAIVRALVLAGRVATQKMTIDEARISFTDDTGECHGAVPKEGVYDGRDECWRKQQLGRIGVLRGESAFPD